jgi:hypothetical protein
MDSIPVEALHMIAMDQNNIWWEYAGKYDNCGGAYQCHDWVVGLVYVFQEDDCGEEE